jgi:hypothetical protein
MPKVRGSTDLNLALEMTYSSIAEVLLKDDIARVIAALSICRNSL